MTETFAQAFERYRAQGEDWGTAREWAIKSVERQLAIEEAKRKAANA